MTLIRSLLTAAAFTLAVTAAGLTNANPAAKPGHYVIAFCMTQGSVENVAQAFADGEPKLALEHFRQARDCFASKRPLRLDAPFETIGVVSGPAGIREIGEAVLRGETIYSWRAPVGTVA